MSKKTLHYLRSFYYSNGCHKNWDSFSSFVKEVGSPVKPRVKLTRKCITKGFAPGNLIWARNTNRSSAYLVKTANGDFASLRHACEQDGVRYHNPIMFMRNYDMGANPQAVFNYSKLNTQAKKAFRRNALANAVRELG